MLKLVERFAIVVAALAIGFFVGASAYYAGYNNGAIDAQIYCGRDRL